MNVEQAIRDYLPSVLHMSLATSANNRPWVCEVHFVYDDNLSLYWRSKPSRRHSQEITANPYIAGAIVAQHGKTQKPRGLYFEGTAEMVTGVEEGSWLHQLFLERLGEYAADLSDIADPDGRQFFKAAVSDWYVFDAQSSTPAKKYHLNRQVITQN